MELVAFLETIGIVGTTAYWLNRQVLKHVDSCVRKYLSDVYKDIAGNKEDHKVLMDRINDLERILVDFIQSYNSEHCSNAKTDQTLEQ